MGSIFTITTVTRVRTRQNQRGGLYDHRDYKTVGFSFELNEAKEWLCSNVMDIYEQGYYPYAVIEEFSEGIYPNDRNGLWYRWEDEFGGYMPCDKPEDLKHVVNFGLG